MTRTRIALTLIFVAMVAMLLGLVASTVVARRLAPQPHDSRPEATEPQRPAGTIVNV
jgi:hypothetical protein